MSPTATKQPTLEDFIVAVLDRLGLPATGPNIAVFAGLARSEGRGLTGWNPLDTTQAAPGATNFNSAGVKNYTSFDQGVAATAQTLNNGLYDTLLLGLKEQQPLSYYVSGPGFVSLKNWQRGPNGASNPPPAAVNVLRASTLAQLLAYARLVAGSSSGSPTTTATTSTMSASSNPYGWFDPRHWIVEAGSASGTAAGSAAGYMSFLTGPLVRGFWVALGLGVVGFGVLLIFAGDIEKGVEKVGDVAEKIAPAAVAA